MKLIRKVGVTGEIWQILIQNSASITGAGLTGLAFNTANLTCYYHRDTDTTATAVSLVTMTAGTFTSSGFKEIDSTNMPGDYQFCPPNAALASGAKSCLFHFKGASNMADLVIEVDLDAQVDVTFWNGTVVATPATAGIPDINVKNINNVAATAVTTVNANQGTTQPVNFTGTAGSALVKADTVDIAGTASAGTPGYVAPDWGNISAKTATVNLSATTISAVSGSVGNVTGTPTVTVTTAGMTSISDNLLDRDMSVGTDSGNQTFRTPRQALRALRNKNDCSSGTTETVYKEDDSTASWTQPITGNASAVPIVKVGT
jgi:hypothetical protein